MLDPLHTNPHTMSGRRAHRRWGRRPSTGGGVDRLKMSELVVFILLIVNAMTRIILRLVEPILLINVMI